MIRKAERYRASHKRGQKRWRAYALALAIILVSALAIQFVLRQLFFYPLRISSDSMAPEIRAGDKRYFVYAKLSSPQRGDVVLVRPKSVAVDFFCRIAALDGDKVKVVDGQFIVNNQVQKNLHPRLAIAEDRSFTMRELEVRPNHFFCLNDNAHNTRDSRTVGVFEQSSIVAKVFQPPLFY